jgi:branched-chain amino acid transport system substrate-binding protein
MKKRYLLKAIAFAAATIATGSSMAQSGTFKIGLITPLTGQQATTGKQMEAGARAYMAMHGDTVNGRKIS